jgi:outer membrane protein, heavy metal efflux system
MMSRDIAILWVAACLAPTANADAQVLALADDLPVLAKGQSEQSKGRTSTQLGLSPGAGGSIMQSGPTAGQALLQGRLSPGAALFSTIPERRNVLSASATPAATGYGLPQQQTAFAPPVRLPEPITPIFPQLEIPAGDDAGPPNGLTLDTAIDLLVRQNGDLNAKFHEIPQAEADVLTASLRANPIVFVSADGVPYGSYSTARPGENGYGATVVQPFDVSGTRRARMQVAERAKDVLQAQYQDAVRLQIDNCYTAFVDVLATREGVRYARASLGGLNAVLRTTEELYRKGQQPDVEVDRVRTQRDSAEIGWQEAIAAHQQAKETLAFLLNIPPEAVNGLEIRAALRGEDLDRALPTTGELIEIGLRERPDLIAFRLGVQRAQADVLLARAEAMPEVFALYTPYGFRNNAPTGGQNATSWGLGAMATVPIFNRNQGNIRRAEINVSQTSAELIGLERQVIAEVRRARSEYDFTENAIQRIEKQILPQARHWRDDKFRLYSEGKEDSLSYLGAHRDYLEVVRQYRDTAVRHRRSMLKLNTAVGLRLLP